MRKLSLFFRNALLLGTILQPYFSIANDKVTNQVTLQQFDKKQNLIFSILNDFPSNYPYSKSQIESYFQEPFKSDVENKNGGIKGEMVLTPLSKNSIFENIELSKDDDKILLINFKQNICYDTKKFDNKLHIYKFVDIEAVNTIDEGIFGRYMDINQKKGLIHLFYDTPSFHTTTCIRNIGFYPKVNFDLKDYEIPEQANCSP